MSLGKYLKYFIIFNIFFAAAPLYIARTFSNNILVPHFWVLFALFDGMTILVYAISFFGRRKSAQSVIVLLGSIGLKLLFAMIVVFVYIRLTPVEPVRFLVCFFYIYLFNSVFEIYCLLRTLRNQNLK